MNTQTDNPYYCPLIFHGLRVEKTDRQKFKVSACCINTPGPEIDLVDFDHNEYLQQQRELVLAHKQVPGCGHCNNHSTGKSPRLGAIENFSTTSLTPDHPTLTKLDWNVDPICNARCAHCNSYFSSAWAAEDQAHGKTLKIRRPNSTRHNTVVDQIDLSRVTAVYFDGGEPMLSADPVELLKRINDIGNISQLWVSMTTNGSIKPSAEFVELLSQCAAFTINFSIDGTGSQFEYIRNLLSWHTVESTIHWWHEQNIKVKHHFNINFTLGVHNIDIVESAHNWFKNLSQTHKNILNFNIYPCHGILSLDHSSKNLKQVWADKFSSPDVVHNTVQRMLENSSSADNDTAWQGHFDMIDQRRNTNWTECLPELHESLKKSQGLQP